MPGRKSVAWQDASIAAALQREFDREHSQLVREMEDLKLAQTSPFHCAICFEACPIDDVAWVEPCGHQFCRDCLRGSIGAKIEEHQYPILCPSCVVGTEKKELGVINDSLVQQLGLTEKQYEAFNEMQMAAFSVVIHCRKCQNTMFVDKAEFATTEFLTCPLRGCQHVWCKNCSQEIVGDVHEHTCDGTSEFKHLMQERGWRYCPGKYQALTQITALSLLRHFCWRCGESITQAKCRLFEYDDEDA
ncbi:uncharacterized protein B0H18DRAFT_966486 [Fomitopsis serialis]|uniref:uncharacterized protein n=1 Tax=Fomitopsis serialis TaxID=139415 RepID=UPI002008318E|nr:uncharacterized protein B0H18DRAFT_966486 [Neoantrodia serialis]KAH9938298.1 hypothetical protein B0H18DRAFT_966486 [Neoantrodia serialis]